MDELKVITQVGNVEWIGVRPGKKGAVKPLDTVAVSPENGLTGDHYSGSSRTRQVTLIQAEYLKVVADIMGHEKIQPEATRRNIVVSGINLNSLKDQVVRIGADVVLEITGICHPCSLMEKTIGPGGYQAMRGHGGLTAKVINGGTISRNDDVVWLRSAVLETSDTKIMS